MENVQNNNRPMNGQQNRPAQPAQVTNTTGEKSFWVSPWGIATEVGAAIVLVVAGYFGCKEIIAKKRAAKAAQPADMPAAE